MILAFLLINWAVKTKHFIVDLTTQKDYEKTVSILSRASFIKKLQG